MPGAELLSGIEVGGDEEEVGVAQLAADGSARGVDSRRGEVPAEKLKVAELRSATAAGNERELIAASFLGDGGVAKARFGAVCWAGDPDSAVSGLSGHTYP